MEINLNQHIGKKLKNCRKKIGMSLENVGQKLGVSIQQVTKYENGINRIPVDALYKLSIIFGVSSDFFFDGFNFNTEQSSHLITSENFLLEKKGIINILLIESDAGDAFIIRKFIEELQDPVNIFSVHDGDDAINFLRGNLSNPLFTRPDIIILELNVPKRDGHAIIYELKRNPETKDIPVIVVTNSLRREDMLNVYKRSASGYILKSGDLDIFRKKIYALTLYWCDSVILPSKG
jgi:transcriptional regulator with XRE-family HTH domain